MNSKMVVGAIGELAIEITGGRCYRRSGFGRTYNIMLYVAFDSGC